jgi:DNA repair exonuclease SbcCD ATPase subunit
VDEDLFAMAVFYGRGFKTFVGLSPKERSELLNRLAKADRWLAAQALVSRWEAQARQSMNTCEAQADSLHGYAEEQHTKAADLLQEAQAVEDTLEQQVAEVQERVTQAEAQLRDAEHRQQGLAKKLDAAAGRLDKVQEQWQEAFKLGASTDAVWVSKSQERERAERALQKDLQAVCEWCGKRLPEEAAQAQHDRITHLRDEERQATDAAEAALTQEEQIMLEELREEIAALRAARAI